ncbi:MAG: NUDIX hydrolase [Candidatus Taylorbacteria bacterium]|nr:NUDIX hydrolase [Candidatus Taylorbacteria bacterium]
MNYSKKVLRRVSEAKKHLFEGEKLAGATSKVEKVVPPRVSSQNDGAVSFKRIPIHFSAGVIYSKIEKLWYIAGITDKRFLRDVKLPGGTNKGYLGESAWETLCRECEEELLLRIDPEEICHPVHQVLVPIKQFFFVVRGWEGTLRDGLTDKWFADTDGEILKARWVELSEFGACCFINHREGLEKATVTIAREQCDRTFAEQAISADIISSSDVYR